jgi:hypothetical protein
VPDDVLHMVAYHSQEGEVFQRTVEGEIIHLADDLSFKPAVLALAGRAKGSSKS